jgi:hypothetical protein
MTNRPVQFPGANALLVVLACAGLTVIGTSIPTAPGAQSADAGPASCGGSQAGPLAAALDLLATAHDMQPRGTGR